MNSLFTPSPVALAYLFVTKFVILELFLILSIPAMLRARGLAQKLALAGLLVALLGALAPAVPAFPALPYPLIRAADSALRLWGGMGLPLIAGGLLCASALAPRIAAPRWVMATVLVLLTLLGGLRLAVLYG